MGITPRRIPELLAPAGDWQCARAAVENGADAIYFGLDRFNARMRADNFTRADLPELMRFLHARGVRGYATFNTLVFPEETADAQSYIRSLVAAGVDAAIVQDIGACRLIRALSDDFPIHASTQMTVTSAAGVEFARELGASLVVLARENSLSDIAGIRSQLEAGPVDLEVFVHGALCVAYSGQCLTSESLGGRSANRGECAQACRLPYELLSDGHPVPLGDRRYLLSPGDLAGIELVPDLVRAGVASLKIEGRLKSPEYVASVTRVYRQALDRCPQGARSASSASDRYELEMAFSRGLSTGWFRGIDNQALVHARFGTKRGVFLGEVLASGPGWARLRPEAPVKPGDGVVFDAGRPEDGEEGGRIYQCEEAGGPERTLRFGAGDINWARVRPGQRVWKTSDPELERRVRATFEGDRIRHRRPVDLELSGEAGAPLELCADDREGHRARIRSQMPLVPAEGGGLTAELAAHFLGRLGGTPLLLGDLRLSLRGSLMIPAGELNRMRRQAVDELLRQREQPLRWHLRPEDPLPPVFPSAAADEGPELIAVIRLPEQLEAAWEAGAATLYCEFENPKHYRSAVARFRQLQAAAGATRSSSIWVAPPRVFAPGEEWILGQVASCGADGTLVRNPDHLRYFQGRRRADFSFNASNSWSVSWLVERWGLERVTASYDLDVEQLEGLLRTVPGRLLDLTLHQRMPMFHMAHCLFCAFLSDGRDYRDCGRPCDRHRVALRDRVGAELPVKADAGCRNTVFNNRAQTGAEFAGRLMALGARHFRVEFVNEPADEVRSTLASYARLLRGEASGESLWRELRLIPQIGVTRGQLEGRRAQGRQNL